MEKASSRSMTISLALPFQESTEMDDDTNEGEESTEMPLIKVQTSRFEHSFIRLFKIRILGILIHIGLHIRFLCRSGSFDLN